MADQPLAGLSPQAVIRQVASTVPPEVRPRIIIVGSLAAAYWLLRGGSDHGVRTKDVDCVLSPYITAVETGRQVAEALLGAGWHPPAEGRFAAPGNSETAVEHLPAVRLYPPGDHGWFIELLAEPASSDQKGMAWTPVTLASGARYGLPSFPFLRVATSGAREARDGIRCALPQMMALANLLEHRDFGPAGIEGTKYKRRNKDLGRVLAMAALSEESVLDQWSEEWANALKQLHPTHWQELAGSCGRGLRRLLESEEDLQEAVEIAAAGLLARRPRTREELRLIGRRVVTFAIEPVEALANQE